MAKRPIAVKMKRSAATPTADQPLWTVIRSSTGAIEIGHDDSQATVGWSAWGTGAVGITEGETVSLCTVNIGSIPTANGFEALASNTTGFNNTATGFEALFSNTIGLKNMASGPVHSRTTRPVASIPPPVLKHFLATPLATAIQPPVLLRSIATPAATITRPLVMMPSLTIPQGAPI